MTESLGLAACLGPRLRAEVERQLIDDLRRYGVDMPDLVFDWSDTCPEGHRTEYLDGELENWSGVVVLDGSHKVVAEGWIEFIHGGGDNPLFVFWEFLTVAGSDRFERVKSQPGIPKQVWARLSDSTKDLCAISGAYWSKDPLVRAWKRDRRLP